MVRRVALAMRPPARGNRRVAHSQLKPARASASKLQNNATAGAVALGLLPALIHFYVLILPLLGGEGKPRIENLLFWPGVASLVLILLAVNWSRADKGFLKSPPIVSLFAYLLLAGISISWSIAPDFAFSRYMLQLLAVIILVVPYAFNSSRVDVIPALHVSSFIGILINVYMILTVPPTPIGHTGYFTHKQELGMFCGATVILAAHELLNRGWRRLLGLFSLCLTIWVMTESQSKSALAFSIVAIVSGAFIWAVCRWVKTTPAFVFAGFVVGFDLLSRVWSDPIGRMSWKLYGDSTLTGRVFIWDWINLQVAQKSWFGWGFHSYWGVPNSPHEKAPGFVKEMLGTHSGYLELKLDNGYIGYWLFLVFIYLALHYLGAMLKTTAVRAWLFFSLTSYILLLNVLESVWWNMSALWVTYLIMVAESVRAARSDRHDIGAENGGTTSRHAGAPWRGVKRRRAMMANPG